jgi:hypothetical protein
MSLTEILAEIPKLSFADRQQLIRGTIELEDGELTPEEKTILDQRLEDFRRNPQSGTRRATEERSAAAEDHVQAKLGTNRTHPGSRDSISRHQPAGSVFSLRFAGKVVGEPRELNQGYAGIRQAVAQQFENRIPVRVSSGVRGSCFHQIEKRDMV